MNFSRFICGFALLLTVGTVFADSRSPELWRDYMHGIVPDKAAKVTVDAIVKKNPAAAKFVSSKEQFKGEPAFAITNKSNLTVTLPIKSAEIKGKKIRLFYWCKGVRAGYNNGWHAPWLVLIARNAAKKNLFTFPA